MASSRLDLLAFGAHPDDVEIFCSGTLIKLGRKGYSTGVYALTRGELGSRGSAEIREREFVEAARIMGLTAHGTLDIPDGQVAPSWENKLKVIGVLREHRPRLVMAPYWEDRHPDHTNASQLIREAVFLAGLARLETGHPPHRSCQLLFYPSWWEFEPSFIVDVSGSHDTKMQAVAAYHSQVHQPGDQDSGGPETPVSSAGFADLLISRARRHGSSIGADFGEPFLVVEPLRLDDPVEFFTRASRDRAATEAAGT